MKITDYGWNIYIYQNTYPFTPVGFKAAMSKRPYFNISIRKHQDTQMMISAALVDPEEYLYVDVLKNYQGKKIRPLKKYLKKDFTFDHVKELLADETF